MNKPLITVLGPTAVGKTQFAVNLASRFDGEIISADSRQVYKFMDIGTGKDIDEYTVDDNQIKYHLIDIIHPSEEYNLFSFQKDFEHCFNDIIRRSKIPFMVGGTGLYLSSILQEYKLTATKPNESRVKELENLDKDALISVLLKLKSVQHNTTDLLNKDRIIKAILIAESKEGNLSIQRKSHLIFGIILQRNEIKKRITCRLKNRLENGMIEEAENLLNIGIPHKKLEHFGLEYKYLSLYLSGKLNYNDMYQKLNSAIHSFAKRQMTWFRKMEREGTKIIWLAPNETDNAAELISKFMSN